MTQQTIISCLWQNNSIPPALPDNTIHMWCAPLNQPPEQIMRLANMLSPDEQERANRFVFDRDREKYIAARGTLRLLLSRYLHIQPEQIQFRYGPQNKPYLAETDNQSPLQFNLAHSHNLAVYGITHYRELGVDIEAIRSLEDKDQIARRFFSAAEYNTLNLLPEAQKLTGFYNCWTRKEAYLKAIGDGLTRPLDQFDVSLRPGAPAKLLAIQGDTQAAAQWSLLEIKPAEEYVGAIAIPGKGWELSCWCWSG